MSATDHAATVRRILQPRSAFTTGTTSYDAAHAALDALVARCEEAEQREEMALTVLGRKAKRVEQLETALRQIEKGAGHGEYPLTLNEIEGVARAALEGDAL